MFFFNNLNNEFSEQYVNFNNKFQKFEIDELLQIEKFSPPLLVSSSFFKKLIKLIRFLLEQRNNTIYDGKPVCFFL